jgi:succinyl-diaminopimelate desuccinylase
LARRLGAIGFRVENLRFGPVDNFWARRGREGPLFCFAGHTDVVPPGPLEEWLSDPFSPEIRDGVLYGRGAADMKSGLAAMVTACEEFVARHPKHRGSIAFLITSDEEGPSVDGTRRVVEVLRERNETIDWCLVGEPSSENALGDTIKIGRRGSLSGRLTVHGVQGHVAYPQFADNPIHALAPALAELTSRTWDQGNRHFQPTTFQVSNISAGTGAPNVIPGELKARFNLRFSTEQTVDTLKATVERILQEHRVRYTLDWFISGYPFLTAPGTLSQTATRAVREELQVTPKLSTGGGTSDGRFIAPLGAQVIELGVVNATIHKANECVRVADVDRLHAVYRRTLELLLLGA